MKLKKIILIHGLDLIAIALAHFLSVFTKNSFVIDEKDWLSYAVAVPIMWVVYTVLSYLFHSYRVLWQYAGTKDVMRLVWCTGVSALVAFAGCEAINRSMGLSICLASFVLMSLFVAAIRLIIRIYLRNHKRDNGKRSDFGRVMVVGAGFAADRLIHDFKINPLYKNVKVACAIDDDPSKKGNYIYGVKIVGNRGDITDAAKKYNVDTIIVAIPSLSAIESARLIQICSATGKTVKTLPSQITLDDEHKVNAQSVRDIVIEDLLGREPIDINLAQMMGYVSGKVVMVTGGGGSIGSELCRQIASYAPKKLIIFDIYENNAYDIQMELQRKFPHLDLTVLIGSVRDEKRLDQVFDKYRPEIVYHAAAHKHVPLMEVSPNEAIKNNVFGTLNTVKAADKYGVRRFVMISTDKAVNPTNVMGATKRMCEMIVQSYNNRSKTEFVAVRFGNVLGSNGSVIPLFKQQIAEGGPVRVTHPDIIRYFMTIPEAVSLVLQAGATAKGGEIFVLDMGQPVKILTLAENLILLSGYKPYTDIKIEFTGLRPGEKLFEELLMSEEGLMATENKLIHIGKPIRFDEQKLFAGLDELREVIKDDGADVRSYIKALVPTYIAPEDAQPKLCEDCETCDKCDSNVEERQTAKA